MIGYPKWNYYLASMYRKILPVSLSYAWDREKNCYIQEEGRFLTYTRNCDQKANVAVVKSALKIPPRHNGTIPSKIKRHVIKGRTAYFISDQDPKKGKTLT